eukprot:6482462-Amphidinium_carterae.1
MAIGAAPGWFAIVGGVAMFGTIIGGSSAAGIHGWEPASTTQKLSTPGNHCRQSEKCPATPKNLSPAGGAPPNSDGAAFFHACLTAMDCLGQDKNTPRATRTRCKTCQ